MIVLDYLKFIDIRIAWPPYSPDQNPCDFFLWGALKDTVHRNNPAPLDELESLIGVACDSIFVETLQDVMSNFIVRLRHLIVSNEEHFVKILLRFQKLLPFMTCFCTFLSEKEILAQSAIFNDFRN